MADTRKVIYLDGQKYAVVYDRTGSFPEKVLRYGEDWQDVCGNNLIYWLCNQIEVLEKALLEASPESSSSLCSLVEFVKEE